MLLQQTQTSGGFPTGWDAVIALIALIALVQPWLHGVYKRFFRKGRVEFFKAGKAAVYYGWQGHIVEVVGTLNAKFEDQFIRALNVRVVRERDSSRHNFEWLSFRIAGFAASGGLTTSFTNPLSFMVTVAQPQRLDVLFYDPDSERDLEPLKSAIQSLWNQFIEQSRQVESPPTVAQYVPATSPREILDETRIVGSSNSDSVPEPLFDRFLETPEVREVWTEIDRHCYWEAGTYVLELEIVTANPEQTFPYSWRFQLTADDAKGLRDNTEVIIRNWCVASRPFATDYIARVDYQ